MPTGRALTRKPVPDPLALTLGAFAPLPRRRHREPGHGDDRQAVLLIWVAEDALHGDGVASLGDDLVDVHANLKGQNPSIRQSSSQLVFTDKPAQDTVHSDPGGESTTARSALGSGVRRWRPRWGLARL